MEKTQKDIKGPKKAQKYMGGNRLAQEEQKSPGEYKRAKDETEASRRMQKAQRMLMDQREHRRTREDAEWPRKMQKSPRGCRKSWDNTEGINRIQWGGPGE